MHLLLLIMNNRNKPNIISFNWEMPVGHMAIFLSPFGLGFCEKIFASTKNTKKKDYWDLSYHK